MPVQLYDRSSEQISKGLNLMDRLLAKDVSKGKIQEADISGGGWEYNADTESQNGNSGFIRTLRFQIRGARVANF